MRFEPLGVLFGVLCGAAGIAATSWHFLRSPRKASSPRVTFTPSPQVTTTNAAAAWLEFDHRPKES